MNAEFSAPMRDFSVELLIQFKHTNLSIASENSCCDSPLLSISFHINCLVRSSALMAFVPLRFFLLCQSTNVHIKQSQSLFTIYKQNPLTVYKIAIILRSQQQKQRQRRTCLPALTKRKGHTSKLYIRLLTNL